MVESISDWANDKVRENPGCVERWNEKKKNGKCANTTETKKILFLLRVPNTFFIVIYNIHPIYYFLYLGIANQDSFCITALVHRKITTSSGLFVRPTRLARQWTACPTLPWVWPSESKYTQIQKIDQVNQNFNILQFTWASAMCVKWFIRYLYV